MTLAVPDPKPTPLSEPQPGPVEAGISPGAHPPISVYAWSRTQGGVHMDTELTLAKILDAGLVFPGVKAGDCWDVESILELQTRCVAHASVEA